MHVQSHDATLKKEYSLQGTITNPTDNLKYKCQVVDHTGMMEIHHGTCESRLRSIGERFRWFNEPEFRVTYASHSLRGGRQYLQPGFDRLTPSMYCFYSSDEL